MTATEAICSIVTDRCSCNVNRGDGQLVIYAGSREVRVTDDDIELIWINRGWVGHPSFVRHTEPVIAAEDAAAVAIAWLNHLPIRQITADLGLSPADMQEGQWVVTGVRHGILAPRRYLSEAAAAAAAVRIQSKLDEMRPAPEPDPADYPGNDAVSRAYRSGAEHGVNGQIWD